LCNIYFIALPLAFLHYFEVIRLPLRSLLIQSADSCLKSITILKKV